MEMGYPVKINFNVKAKPCSFEAATFVLVILAQLIPFKDLLFTGKHSIIHDNIYWHFPGFHFFAQNLLSGSWPIWNPYTNFGEPFYPIISHLRLYEPVSILATFIGALFTKDSLILFHWARYLESLLMLFGVYQVLRLFVQSTFARCLGIPTIFCSTMMVGSFIQDAIINQFMWAPWVIFYLLRIAFFNRNKTCDWLFMSICFGLNFQSYFFAGLSIFIFFFILSILVFDRHILLSLVRSQHFYYRVFISIGILALMSGLNLFLYSQKSKLLITAHPQVKQKDQTEPTLIIGSEDDDKYHFNMNYDYIRESGTNAKILDFIYLVASMGRINPEASRLMPLSEAFQYIGTLSWILALYGMVFVKNPLKPILLSTLFCMFLYNLGYLGGLQEIMFYIYPPSRLVRHTHTLTLFFQFIVILFSGLGLEMILIRMNSEGVAHVGKVKSASMGASMSILLILLLILLVKGADSEYGRWLLLSTILFLFVVWKTAEKAEFLLVVITAQVICALFMNFEFKMVTFFAVYSAAIFILFKYRKSRPHPGESIRIIQVGIILMTVMDLALMLYDLRPLYHSQGSVKRAVGLNTVIHSLKVPTELMVAPPYSGVLLTGQAIRYQSLMRNEKYSLAPLHGNSKTFTFEDALTADRWNSFLALKPYFKLLNSPIKSSTKKSVLSVGSPMLFFREGFVLNSSESFDSALHIIDRKENGHSFFERFVLLENRGDTKIGESLSQRIERANLIPNQNSFQYEVLRFSSNFLEISITSEKSGFLVWVDGFDGWWRAFLNQSEIQIRKANGAFKAVPIQKGKSRVRFEYYPLPYLLAAGAFYLAIAIGVLTLVGQHCLRKNA